MNKKPNEKPMNESNSPALARAPRAWLLLGILVAGGFHLAAYGYNSDEHILVSDLGINKVTIPTDVALPAAVGRKPIDKVAYLGVYKAAKMLAVGFATNNPGDFDKWAQAQDNCYFPPVFGQLDYNKQLWIPGQIAVPDHVFVVPAHAWGQARPFHFGHLVSLYGDYRRTASCNAGATCYLTDGDTPQVRFAKGNARRKFCPATVDADVYLRAIGSGLVPPFGSGGNTTSNTAKDGEYGEAGWWGDEMLRIANVNDWHFSNVGVAWYAGLHRLALIYVDKARTDPKYWIQALHYEANALHSLTDLFAFGHVATHRDETSYGIMKDQGLLGMPAYQWMENVIAMGGGQRSSSGRVTLQSQLPLPADRSAARNDFMKSYRGTWAKRADWERRYHDEFNKSGATVRNLRGDRFFIYGDGRLHDMDPAAQLTIASAVTASVQSLFDAYVKLQEGSSTVAALASAGSPYFEALTYLPVFVEADHNQYFLGRWALYAKAADEITGKGKVPNDWARCAMPYLSGADGLRWPPRQTEACTSFPSAPG